ncbi:MAG: MarR family winged helix-turn-helix transcriptional regulator [Candidatus Acidiferrales bacterium]
MSSEAKRPTIAEILAALRAIDGDMDRLDEAAAARLGVSRSDFRCLDILSRGKAMTPGQLAVETGLTTGAVTALLDRLEKAGYVRRERDRTDRRKVLVHPSRRAAAEVWPIFRGVAQDAAAILDTFTSRELEIILRFLETNRGAIHTRLSEGREKGSTREARRIKSK